MSGILGSMSFTIATVNVNGLRAAHRKGFVPWLGATTADLVTLQEVRAPESLVPELVGPGWSVTATEAVAKGRAGVAVAVRGDVDLSGARAGLPTLADDAHTGRWLEVDVHDPLGDGRTLTAISAYVHSGNVTRPQSMTDKYAFLDAMQERLAALRADGRHVVLTGDLNIAHTEWDIKNWKGNLKSAGFLPEERAHLDRLLADGTWVDVQRALYGDGPGPYTWWSQRGQAFDNDSGWRIDYQLATADLAAHATSARVDRAPSYDTRWSDHAPLVIRYD